jgi:hypothetical protein
MPVYDAPNDQRFVECGAGDVAVCVTDGGDALVFFQSGAGAVGRPVEDQLGQTVGEQAGAVVLLFNSVEALDVVAGRLAEVRAAMVEAGKG